MGNMDWPRMDHRPIASDALRASTERLDCNRDTRPPVELRTWKTKLAQTEKLGQIGSWEIDLGTGALFWSDGTYRVFDLTPGHPVTVELALSFYDPAAQAEIAKNLHAARGTGRSFDLTVPFTSHTGRNGWVRTLGQYEEDGESSRIVGVIKDVTDERRLADQLRQLAYTDVLTGLPNRRCFEEHFSAATAAAGDERFGLYLVDVDHFKIVNDAHGHVVGD